MPGNLPSRFETTVTYSRRAESATRKRGWARSAREEGFDEIADWFETLAKAERSHAGRFQRAYDELK